MPSSSRQRGNENMMGRASTLPVVLKWQQHDEEGHAPRCRIKKGKENTMERAPWRPPCRVEMATT